MNDPIKDFLDLYPDHGPDAGTGPWSRARCVCGHLLRDHSGVLGVCMVIEPTQMMRADGEPTRIEWTYCRCLDYKDER